MASRSLGHRGEPRQAVHSVSPRAVGNRRFRLRTRRSPEERHLLSSGATDTPAGRPATPGARGATRGGVGPALKGFAVLGRSGRSTPISLGERVQNLLVLLTRLDPGAEMCFPGVGDVVDPACRTVFRGFPLGLAEPFLLH